MKRSLLLGFIAAAGIALLWWAVPRAHPAVQWRISCDRETAQIKAREMSAAFGIDTSGWTASVNGDTFGAGGFFAGRHPEIAGARRFSPVYPHVVLVSPGGREKIAAELSAAGEINRWRREGHPKAKTLDEAAARALAGAALVRFAGRDADQFRPVPSPSENDGELLLAFERGGPLPERFEATVNGGLLVKAELRPTYSPQVSEAMSARKKYVNWLDGIAGAVIYTLGTVLAACVYVFWSVRRAVRHRFVLALAATCIPWGAVYWTNWMQYGDHLSGNNLQISGNFFAGACVLLLLWFVFYLMLAGATDAVGQGSKLATLRSIFSPWILNRRSGAAIWTGMLCGPLLAALPLAVSSLRLFGSEHTGNYDASVMFAARPTLQALDVLISPALLGFFGFGFAQAPRFVPRKWLANALLATIGTVLLASLVVPAETNPVPLLLSGGLLFAAYRQLFRSVDLLAVLSAGWCAEVLWNASALAVQPARSLHNSGLAAFAWLAVLAGCGGLVALFGRRLAVEEDVAPATVTSQRESLMNEFSIAHRVQKEMLPERPPEIPGCTLSASCQPAQEVGGDLFDFLPLPDGRWTIGVGDVSGKGVPAALYMTLTKGLLIATTQDSSDLAEIIGNVNRHVHAATDRKTFVTMALGAYHPETRSFDHVRAGHNPVVWRRAADGATQLLNSPGLGLGIVSDRLFRRSVQVQRLQLGSGDTLVFYSDGLTEAMNLDREQFGEERLMRSLDHTDGLDAGAVRERIVAGVTAFLGGIPPQDDMTVVVLRVN